MAETRAQKLRSWDTIKHELLRAAHTWSPFSGTAWGCSLIIARFVVNLCVRGLIIRPSILVLSKKLYATALRCDRNYCTRRRKLHLYVCDSQGPGETSAGGRHEFLYV
jgi:hypothetical protein